MDDLSDAPATLTSGVSWSQVQRLQTVLMVAIIISGTVMGAYLLLKHQVQIGAGSTQFALTEHGTTHWYLLEGNTLTPLKAQKGFELLTPRVLEAAPQLKTKDIPVLSASNTLGSVLGVLRNGVVIPLNTTDAGNKLGLVDTPAGLLAYAKYVETKPKQGSPAGSWMLESYTLYQTPAASPRVLGPGAKPRFTGDGNLLAIAPEGLVRIDPIDGGRSTLIARSGTAYSASAISLDATMVLLPNRATNALDLFSIHAPHANAVSYIGSLPGIPFSVDFVNSSSFVTQDGAKSFSLYTIQKNKIQKTETLTVSPNAP